MFKLRLEHKTNVATLIDQIIFENTRSISHLLTLGEQRKCTKIPLCGIAVYLENELLCSTKLNHPIMKVLSESFRSFFEGFASFYTSIFDEMKKW